MLAIFLDGESKSGKTAVGRNVKRSLEEDGYNVRLIVAGHFFRFLTKLALEHRIGSAADIDDELIKKTLAMPELYGEMPDAKELNTHQIDKWVSQVGQRTIVQDAAQNWRTKAAERALEEGIEIALLDGRNQRGLLAGWCAGTGTPIALELIIACRPEAAAARYLGRNHYTKAQLDTVSQQISERRRMDRRRAEAAYEEPKKLVELLPGTENVKNAIEAAWASNVTEPPLPIRFDNSDVPLKLGLKTVTELAEKSVLRIKSR